MIEVPPRTFGAPGLLALLLAASACGPREPAARSSEASHLIDPLYEDEAGFTALGPAAPGSWRARVREPSQSFADYRASQPNRPTPGRRTLYLQPIAPYPSRPVLPEDLPSVKLEEEGFVTFVFSPAPEQLAEFLSIFWGLPSEVRPELPLDGLGLAPARIHKHHGQFDARELLAAIEPSLPDAAYSMTALVARDLVVDGRQEFAYGYGLHVERLAVASFAQLDPQFIGRERSPEFQARIRERAYKLLAHEVGHTLGIAHCEVHACVMNGVAHLDELDATPLRLCPLCLRKLTWLVELDPVARYRELARHYADEGIDPSWVRGRLERLEPGYSGVGASGVGASGVGASGAGAGASAPGGGPTARR